MKIGIIGYGHVGMAMGQLFKTAIIYDKYKAIGSQEDINDCDVSFVCVPTPSFENGECDTSAVEEVISWCKSSLIIIRSTVKIGFSRAMREKYHKEIVFQPEYLGETVAHPYTNLSDRKWLTFGGTKNGIDKAIKVYQMVIGSDVRIYQCTSDEAEMAKYVENAFLATKVIFCNEMFDLCEKMGINYNVVRELWVADPRIGTSHTFIYEKDRGFGGSCLPKDTLALLKQGHQTGTDMTLLNAVLKKNSMYHSKHGKTE